VRAFRPDVFLWELKSSFLGKRGAENITDRLPCNANGAVSPQIFAQANKLNA